MGHRRFLQKDHRFKFNRSLFNGRTELRDTPIPLTGSDIFKQVEGLNVTFGKPLETTNTSKRARTNNVGVVGAQQWRKRSIFFNLPYWETNLLRHCLDVMHIEKNVCDNVLYTLLNDSMKSKDNLKARKVLKEMGIRKELWSDDKGRFQPALFSLSKAKKKTFLQTLKSVKMPDGYSSNISRCIDLKNGKIFGLKSHDCHILMEQLLPIAIRNLLPDNVQSTQSTSESVQPTPEFEPQRVGLKKGRQSNHYWLVEPIDEHGVSQNLKVKVKDALNLPSGVRVVVNYDDKYQPIGEASAFLRGMCGLLATNHIFFPISFERWQVMPDTYKDNVWESSIKTRFIFKINEDLAKKDIMFKIGKLWMEYRCKLWNEFYDPLVSRNELIKNVPEGLNMEQWAVFVDYRLKPSTMDLCTRNRDIRKRQTIPHTSEILVEILSRRRDNLKIKTGRNVGRAELWKITHKRKNGTYVNDEAVKIGEKIDDLVMQNPECASDISPNDPIGVIFGKEHPGRVRGLSAGACPTIVFQQSTTRLGGVNFASSSTTSRNTDENFMKIENGLSTVKNQVQKLLAYIASKEDVPEHLAAMAIEVPDVRSGVPSPNDVVGSSGGSKPF